MNPTISQLWNAAHVCDRCGWTHWLPFYALPLPSSNRPQQP